MLHYVFYIQTENRSYTGCTDFISKGNLSGCVKRSEAADSNRKAQRDSRVCLFPFLTSIMDPEASPHSPDEETAILDQIPKCHRSMRSLNLLATKFVKLLQQAEDGVLDLKDVSQAEDSSHKHQYSYTY